MSFQDEDENGYELNEIELCKSIAKNVFLAKLVENDGKKMWKLIDWNIEFPNGYLGIYEDSLKKILLSGNGAFSVIKQMTRLGWESRHSWNSHQGYLWSFDESDAAQKVRLGEAPKLINSLSGFGEGKSLEVSILKAALDAVGRKGYERA